MIDRGAVIDVSSRAVRFRAGVADWLAKVPQGQFWIYFGAAVLFNLGFSIFHFLFNLYLLGFGMNERSLGLIGSCTATGSILATIPAGILAERVGLRKTLSGGVTLAVVFCVLRVCLVSPVVQLVLAVGSGATMCCWAVCLSPSVAGLTTERERPVGFSLMFASGIGVAGIGAFIAGRLPGWMALRSRSGAMSLLQSERAALLLACGIAALAILPLSRLVLGSGTRRKRLVRPTGTFLRRFLPAMAAWSLVTGAFPPFATVYLVHHLGLSLSAMGTVFSLSQLVQVLAVLAAPLLFRRTGLPTGVMLSQLITAGMLLLLAGSHNVSDAKWLFWGYMAAQCMNEPGIYSLLMDSVPAEERSAASSYTFFLDSGARILTSTAVGMAIVRFGYPAVLCAIAALAIVAAGLFRRLASGLQGA